ncbi:MAG TPA: 2-oxoglutarate dehydrogenase complex dihydrolipoyllysine-residue succinyltransferase [Gammaproteobacteria bacterium]|nr:2-oxoglutarate dehydrogenase complex dihydrolipoyllysine-residue succinyltransferase [Gammaproteobacteria bacterium]
MTIEIKVPPLPESVADATILTWHKKPGDAVKRDENLVDLETDKVVIEVPAVADGILKDILKPNGTKVNSGELLGNIEAGKAGATAAPAAAPVSAPVATPAPAATSAPATTSAPAASAKSDAILSPSVRRAVASGEKTLSSVSTAESSGARTEQRVPMSRLRARVAERLLAAQHNSAILTTFNEVNLQNIMDLRAKYKDQFEKLHNVRLGFMSFFTRAVVEALKKFPAVNASIDGGDIVYHGYYDIGVAVSTDRGLVVPVIRDADQLSLADIEKKVAEYGKKARDNQLTMEEITGGTFTITNGGVFGSLLSTPILNPPQSAILGMHKIEERPVVENGQIVIRPMMYLAMSYDHRMIDGKESVRFLVTVKELLEDPSRLLLEI